MKRKNLWIILSALGLNFLFLLILVAMNRTPELNKAQEKLHAMTVWQVQSKVSKTPGRKKSQEKPVKKTKKKKLKLKTVSLNKEKMKPRKTRRITSNDIQPSRNSSDAEVMVQTNYVANPNTEDEQILELNEVDKAPWKIKHIQPVYPYQAKHKRIEGSVTLQFLVDEKGKVSEVRVLKVNGFDGFGTSAKKAVLKWRFKPATYFGKPVAVRCVQKIAFNLKGL